MTFATDLATPLNPLVNNAVFRADEVPQGTAYPYISIMEQPYETGPALKGDRATLAYSVVAQVDVWQLIADEDEALTRSVVAALNGLRLSAPRRHLQVVSIVRVPEQPPVKIVHHAITVQTIELG